MRDVNLELAGLLFDMASLAGDAQRGWGYKRAAKAVLRIDRHITPLVEANTFRGIPGIGPTTDRIARELIQDGHSAFVTHAISAAGKEKEVAALRGLRQHFLSRATVKEILARRGTPSRAKYRGDFQMHSVWSDGAEPLASIVDACLARGQVCAGITDHSYGLPIAGGMTMAQVVEQHAEIDALNRQYEGRFRMFKGIEANIRQDGTVDMEPDELRQFEFVVASPHSLLRKSIDQTARMVGAVSQPGVCDSRPSAGAAVQRAARRERGLGPGVRGGGQTGGGDRNRRLVGPPGRALRAGGAGARARLPLRARQRRALAPGARLHRHCDRPRPARGYPAEPDRQLLAGEAVSEMGEGQLGPLVVGLLEFLLVLRITERQTAGG